MSISARFSENPYFDGVDPRVRGAAWAKEAARIHDLRDVSLLSVQASVLLGCHAITEGDANGEAVYYGVGCRMAMLLDLIGAPTRSRLEREVRIRVWWSLRMIDVWSSAGVRLPRSLSLSSEDAPLPMDETTFLLLRPDDDQVTLPLGYNSEHSLLSQMIKLNAILVEVNTVNEQATSHDAHDFHDYERIELISQELEAWLDNIPDEMRDTPANLARYASRGLGSTFVAVYLGFYNFGQMLHYQFLHSACHSDHPLIRSYATRCKANATSLCQMIYRAHGTPNCKVTYSMVGHILVIASSVQMHTLLFSPDEAQIRAARQMLEHNFALITELQRLWPSLDLCFARLRAFHRACLRSQEASFKMDRWMLRFLLEFAKPVGDKGEGDGEWEEEEEGGRDGPELDTGPLTVQSLGMGEV